MKRSNSKRSQTAPLDKDEARKAQLAARKEQLLREKHRVAYTLDSPLTAVCCTFRITIMYSPPPCSMLNASRAPLATLNFFGRGPIGASPSGALLAASSAPPVMAMSP